MDANVYIAVEPFSGTLTTNLEPAARLLRNVAEQGHRLFVHPAVRDDISRDRDRARAAQRLAELNKYQMLDETPISAALLEKAGPSPEGSNDHRDLRLLAALSGHAVNYLVSEDIRLSRRAARAGLTDAVLTIAEAVALLDSMRSRQLPPPPKVESIPSYALDVDQPIFRSLQMDYPGFDEWLAKVQADMSGRVCFVVREQGEYEAIALLKREGDCHYPFREPVLKIATFKVAEGYAGSKYGELLLKAIFNLANDEKVATLYVEVFAKHERLAALLEDFGFARTDDETSRQEAVYAKSCLPDASSHALSDLEYHRQYGPPALRPTRVFLVPVEPKWHEQLFPDAPRSRADLAMTQLTLPGMAQDPHPWGNALRKAYLTQSKIKKLQQGDVLLFYRSHDRKSVDAVGIVEQTYRSRDPAEIITFVGRRTVYTPAEITGMCRGVVPPLAILFRQDRFIDPPWSLGELVGQRVMKSWPQSITEVARGEGLKWIQDQLVV